MRLVVAGLILIALAVALVIFGRPRAGRFTRFVTLPVLDTVFPLLVTSAVALGMAMIVAGMLT